MGGVGEVGMCVGYTDGRWKGRGVYLEGTLSVEEKEGGGGVYNK